MTNTDAAHRSPQGTNLMPAGEAPLTLCDVLEEEFHALHGDSRDRARDDLASSGNGGPSNGTGHRLTSLWKRVHALARPRSALCLSGGGIRSATFSLGVLQGLARRGLLSQFDYLSTVSGGGYIGSWLSSWVARSGLEAATTSLAGPDHDALDPEPPQVQWLRSYSNYLSPKMGAFSVDWWTLIATIARNLLLHWLLLLPLLATGVMIPRLALALVRLQPDGPLAGPLVRSAVLAAALMLTILALTYIECDLPSAGNARMSQGSFIRACLLPLLGSALLLTVFWSWHAGVGGAAAARLPRVGALPAWAVCMAAGVGVHLVGWACGRLARGADRETLARWGLELRPREPSSWLDVSAVVVSGACAGGLLWTGSRLIPRPADVPAIYAWLAVPILLLSFLLALTLYVGLASKITTEDDREWWARWGAWLLIAVVAWIGAVGLVLYAKPVVDRAIHASAALTATGFSLGGVSGMLAALGGYFSRSGLGKLADEVPRGLRGRAVGLALQLGCLLFVVVVLVGLACGAEVLVWSKPLWLLAWQIGLTDSNVELGLVVTALVLLACLMSAMSRRIGVNRFSIHAMYGNRLVRAYLGATRNPGKRRPNPLTGFDPDDSIDMHRLRCARDGTGAAMLHVVNAALNLVKGERLAWQQRKAESFTFSPLHCGSSAPGLGYRRSQQYTGDGGVSLAKAMTISGAAASPNMGYHSAPLVTFIMTLFNVRLGWWLGNPALADCSSWRRSEPASSLQPLLDEALGLTTDTNPYVYLSDGGHFENLALYEMVLRRCRRIVVVDAGCDPKYEYEDLAAAIQKIRADLGVPITFAALPKPADAGATARSWTIGTIHYSEVDAGAPDGQLLYLKPLVNGREPIDVRHYAATHASGEDHFPQQSTADQWFDEAQFESYRALGRFVVDDVDPGSRASDLADLFARAVATLAPPCEAARPDARQTGAPHLRARSSRSDAPISDPATHGSAPGQAS